MGFYMDIGLPNQAYQAGVEWADDPSLSTVTTCAYKWGPGSGTKMGKAASQLSIISSSPELLLILVGWFPNNIQRLTRIQKQNTRRRYNLMSQALMVPYFNDWLGWFYPGYSGFHPQKR